MHPIMLRVPDSLWDELKAAAEQEHRSVNGQIIWLIEEWLAGKKGK